MQRRMPIKETKKEGKYLSTNLILSTKEQVLVLFTVLPLAAYQSSRPPPMPNRIIHVIVDWSQSKLLEQKRSEMIPS
jgi:hypothetical protein